MSFFTANVYGEYGGDGEKFPYIKKAGDTATGLIIFNGGIQTNVGDATFNGPIIANDQVTINDTGSLYVDAYSEFADDVFCSDAGKTLVVNGQTTFNNLVKIESSGLSMQGGTDIDFYGGGYVQWAVNQGGGVIYEDQTIQQSAYTGAKLLAGSYTNTSMTLNNEGKITALANGAVGFSMPPGSIVMFGGGTIPAGWILCDSTIYPINGALYVALFAVIGYTYGGPIGPIAGITYFSVPDMRNNFPIGGTNFNPPAANFFNGTTNFQTLTGGSNTISVNALPDHSHDLTFPTAEYVNNCTDSATTGLGGTGDRLVSDQKENFPTDTDTTINRSAASQSWSLPPFVAVNFIIKL